ncbi:unnamed protein product, partial [Amoebophrya sp. A25]
HDLKKYAPLGLSGEGSISLSEFIDPDCKLLDEWRTEKEPPKARVGLNLTQRLATVAATLEYEAEDMEGRSKRVAENWKSSLGLAVREVPRDTKFPLARLGSPQDHVRRALFVVAPTTTSSGVAAKSAASSKKKSTKRAGAASAG